MDYYNVIRTGIALFLILLIPAVFGEIPDTSTWNTYNDTVTGFGVQYPAESNLFFSASNESREISITDLNNVTICSIQIIQTSKPLSEISASREEEIRALKGVSELKVSNETLGGLPAVLIEYAQKIPDSIVENRTHEIFATDDALLYSIRTDSNITSYEKNLNVTRSVENSFIKTTPVIPEKGMGDGYQTYWNYPGQIYDPFGMVYNSGYGGWYPVSYYPYTQINPESYNGGYYYPGYTYDGGDEEGYSGTYPTGTYTVEPTSMPYNSETSCQTGDSSLISTTTPTPEPQVSSSKSEIQALVVVAPKDYNEEELTGVTTALENSNIRFDIASSATGTATGMSGGTTPVTLSFNDVKSGGIDKYSGIILIGGEGAMTSLYDDQVLRELVTTFDQKEKLISAICASPVVLSRAGILRGKTVTLFGDPQGIEEIKNAGGVVSEDAVVTDGRIITGNGPYAAQEFGTTVASALLK